MRPPRPASRPRGSLALLAAAGLALAGACDGPAPSPGPPGPEPGSEAPVEASAFDAALVVTGAEEGWLRPWPGARPPRGGLERRAVLLDRLRARGAPVLAVSAGEALGPGDPRQGALKADLLRAVQSALDYGGGVLSPGDLSPAVTAVSQPIHGPSSTPRPPLNVRLKPAGPLAATARADPILRARLGDLPVRVVSLADPTTQSMLAEEWGVADIVVPPEVALKALVREPGVLVVVAHVMREDMALVASAALGLADAVLVVDMLGQVGTRRPVRGRTLDRPLLVAFESRGREAGVLRLSRAGAGWTASYDAVPLGAAYEGGASPSREVVAGLLSDYRARVRAAGLLAAQPAAPAGRAAFVGSAACQPCHPGVHEAWAATRHAVALATLEAADAAWDPECVVCHTTGWSRDGAGAWSAPPSAFRTPEASSGLAGVGCESCHGPGSEHARAPQGGGASDGPGLPGSMPARPSRSVCLRCHGRDDSPGFHAPSAWEEKYLPAVDHREVAPDRRTLRR